MYNALRIYIVSMDIQRYSMDALLVCTTVHVHVLQIYIVSISRDVEWMPCWFALLYMYMYMYFGYPEMFNGCLVGLHYCTCTCTSDIHCIHGYPEKNVLWTSSARWEIIKFNIIIGKYIAAAIIMAIITKREVEASRREARVPREGDPVSALPTTPCVSSTSGSSPFCLLDVRLVLWGLWEAIIANNSLLSACVMSDTYPCS